MENDGEEHLPEPPDEVIDLLTDSHCHPTDDPRPWGKVEVLIEKLRYVKIGRACAMSTSTKDQEYVAKLSEALPNKIIPAFGYHPWFVHTISTNSNINPEEHYKTVFGKKADSDELQELLQGGLPDPIPIQNILQQLRDSLEAHPDSLLGEIGIDRVFRLPRNPKGWTREPDLEDIESNKSPSLGRRKRPLTSLTPSIEHQVEIAKAQIALAIELKRSISFHSVRAGGALTDLLEDLRKSFPDENEGLSKRERKRREKEQRYTENGDDHSSEEAKSQSRLRFNDINLDLHSCTLSPQMISQIQKKYPNIYVSFSLAINSRQKDLIDQLRACDPNRLLIESDWHSAEGLGSRCWAMIKLATDIISDDLVPKDIQGEERYKYAAKRLHENWRRFSKRDD
jgi:Tat protein secretion system quality control protein TatD with DNase activity